MAWNVGIARRGSNVDVWVFGLPGCRAIGDTADEAIGLVPVVIAEHLAWLGSHGVTVNGSGDVEVEVVEDVDAIRLGEFVFEADKEPLTPEELKQILDRIQFAHADLMALVSRLPDVVLDWRPPESSVRIDDIFPDVRSIRDMVTHVAQALSFHLRGVGAVAERVPAPPDAAGLPAALETAISRIRSMDAEELSGEVYRVAGRNGEAQWTARKALRRMLNHQRFHLKEMQQRLCWLTLGIPDVRPVSRE